MGRRGFAHAKETGMLTISHAIVLTGICRKLIKKSLELNQIEGAFMIPNGREWRIPAVGLYKYCIANNMPIHKDLQEIAKTFKDQFEVT